MLDSLVSVVLALFAGLVLGRRYGLTRRQKAGAVLAFTALAVPVRYAILGLTWVVILVILGLTGRLE